VSCIERAKLLPVELNGCGRIDDTKPFHFLAFERIKEGIAPTYGDDSEQSKREELTWLRLNNNSTCPITIPTINSTANRELKDGSEVPVIYKLTTSCIRVRDRVITKREPELLILAPGKSILFAVPLRFPTREPFNAVRVPLKFETQPTESYYEFYFFRSELPEKLRKEVDCTKF